MDLEKAAIVNLLFTLNFTMHSTPSSSFNLYVPVLYLVTNEIQTIKKEMLINPLWYDKV